jgi:hypothetical protein
MPLIEMTVVEAKRPRSIISHPLHHGASHFSNTGFSAMILFVFGPKEPRVRSDAIFDVV